MKNKSPNLDRDPHQPPQSDHDHDALGDAHNAHSHGEHAHENGHDHNHDAEGGFRGFLGRLFHTHGHEHGLMAADDALYNNDLGIRTVWIALVLLLLTTVMQIVIVLFSGSVALLADTVHNLGDGLNSIPLLVAFYLARRVANRRYNYGYGKAEDVAGIFIVLSIAVSAGIIFWESFEKLTNPSPINNVGWVAAAAIIGFIGNEAVAILQIRVGRRIGSAAMEADGLHARTDGLTSLAVLVAAIGTWLGAPIIDPIIGILIGIAILLITRDATKTMWYRLMDAIDPALLDQAESTVNGVAGVRSPGRTRLRWMGHRLHADVVIGVDPSLSTAASHEIVEEVRHALFHDMAMLEEVVVHAEPWAADGADYHPTTHHEPLPQPLAQ